MYVYISIHFLLHWNKFTLGIRMYDKLVSVKMFMNENRSSLFNVYGVTIVKSLYDILLDTQKKRNEWKLTSVVPVIRYQRILYLFNKSDQARSYLLKHSTWFSVYIDFYLFAS